MHHFKVILFCLPFLLFIHCKIDNSKAADIAGAGSLDPHSYSRPEEAVTRHLDLILKVDFHTKILTGKARWKIDHKNASRIIFDTKDLNIQKTSITDHNGGEKETKFSLSKPDELLGQALTVNIEPTTEYVTIEYTTSPASGALLWLSKDQTSGKQLPFLFTQGQAIYTRSWIPCQDSPGIRFTYKATVSVPPGHLALMSAKNPQEKTVDGVYEFDMELPIPPYLMALAVGDLVYEPISKRCGVYAEPDMSDRAFIEFEGTEAMIKATEALYGPYPWGMYDILVLPPSFPFGGMENPRLTFVTPTIIAGDRSLVSLIAHELAHSWSGNLVTNATWDDFWLNEGVTTYIERRIMEAVNGKDYADMLAEIGYQDLEFDVQDLGPQSPMTHLKLTLKGKDPDEGSNDIAYEKGAYFLTLLEQTAGRERFDEFLKLYFSTFRFKTITTAEFITFLNKNLIEKYSIAVNIEPWINGPGIPENCPRMHSQRFERVNASIQNLKSGERPSLASVREWSAHEWIHFIRHLPKNLDDAMMKRLDYSYNFSDSENAEIQAAWYELAIQNGYSQNILPQIEAFLVKVGRRKFLVPIYRAFMSRGQKAIAEKIYAKARPGYHAVSSGTIDKILDWKADSTK